MAQAEETSISQGGAARTFGGARWLRTLVQVIGAGVGLALLVWAGRLALAPENQPALEQLRASPAHLVLALVGLTVVAIAIDGAIFWLTMRPLRRHSGRACAPLSEVIAVNAVATFLNPLPFKLGMVARGALHVRCHGVGVKELVSWLAGFGGLTVVAMGALAVASIVRPTLDGAWMGIAGGLVVLGCAGMLVAGALARRFPALQKLSLGAWPIAADPVAVVGSVLLRLSHVLLYALRFIVVAKMMGQGLSMLTGVQLGLSYLLVQSTAPTGTLGVAEAVTAKVGQAVGMELEKVALMVLVTTAAQTLVAAVLSLIALAWLRPWRPRPAVAAPSAAAQPGPTP